MAFSSLLINNRCSLLYQIELTNLKKRKKERKEKRKRRGEGVKTGQPRYYLLSKKWGKQNKKELPHQAWPVRLNKKVILKVQSDI